MGGHRASVLSPRPSSTDTELKPSLSTLEVVVATSGLRSRLKSPTATEFGRAYLMLGLPRPAA